ncbi:hypothetical protein PENSPDRAFT_695237 [Peniophora sp. CONT]|nr:hypothetical protein PENSPDRAFT_695237 [Peniophora sp. CONT]
MRRPRSPQRAAQPAEKQKVNLIGFGSDDEDVEDDDEAGSRKVHLVGFGSDDDDEDDAGSINRNQAAQSSAVSQQPDTPARPPAAAVPAGSTEPSFAGAADSRPVFDLNSLAYSHLGELQFEPVLPDGFRAGVDASVRAPSFVDWFQTQAQQRADRNSPRTSDQRALAANAHSLLTLARITHGARVQAHEIESIRGITGSLLQTPFVAQATSAQNQDLRISSRRDAYLWGVGHAEKMHLGSTHRPDSGS